MVRAAAEAAEASDIQLALAQHTRGMNRGTPSPHLIGNRQAALHGIQSPPPSFEGSLQALDLCKCDNDGTPLRNLVKHVDGSPRGLVHVTLKGRLIPART